jgi:hypothetical protein
MYGKHFASMYEGSMIGAGSHVFAVMGYVIAHWRPDKDVGGQVRLNPDLLCHIIGEPVERIHEAIEYLTSPDQKSTTPVESGRRLIKIGQFDYRVVNAMKYHEIQSEESKREANRIRQQKHREKIRPVSRQTIESRVHDSKIRQQENGQ